MTCNRIAQIAQNNHRFLKALLVCIFAMSLMACQKTGYKKTPNNAFDLDILYSQQNLIGTTPIKPVWSPDSQQLAFLWNDKGLPLRDVWLYSLTSGEKKPLTTYAVLSASDVQTTGVSEVVWLDNNRLLYVINGQLYVVGLDGRPQAIEQDKKGIRSIQIAPNGQDMAFVFQGGLWVRSTDVSKQGSRLLVDSGHDKAFIQRFEWGSNNDIAFQLTDTQDMPERDIHYYADGALQTNHVQRAFPGQKTARFTVGRVTLDGQIRWFDRDNDYDYVWDYGLSSDGQALYINTSDPLAKHHKVLMYDVKTGQKNTFYEEFDAKHLRPDWQVSWAPNDQGLVILTDKGGYLHLYHQSDESTSQTLTNGDWEIKGFSVDHNNRAVYFTANSSFLSDRQVYRVDMNGGDIKRISDTITGSHEIFPSPDGQFIASLYSNDATPQELLVIDVEQRNSSVVTHSPLPSFGDYDWADISYIMFNSHVDGVQLVGRLSVPVDYDENTRYPLIVGSVYSDSVQNQYGGRTAHPTWGLDQYLVAQGYIVLNVNVRGSWGQGREHNQGLRHSYGVIDIEDLHSGVQYLVDQGMVDPKRVGIWGSSYGGLMTMMSLFKKPGVYAAGIAGAPATNVAHAYPGQMWVMGEPDGDDQPQRYQNQSALYHTAGLQDPLMIIHGTKDQVVLYSDTIAVIEKLIAQQKMFELVTLPGTGHGWDNEGNDVRLFSFKKMIEFFNLHVRDK